MFKLLFLLLFPLLVQAQTLCYFTPPKDWELMDPKGLSRHVKVGFIGKSDKGFQPSINLAVEEVSVSLAEYIKAVKNIHETDPSNRWRDLGRIKTRAGEAKLTEVDTNTKWGPARLLQLILLHENKAYVLTACALKEEFSGFYGQFQTAFHSLSLANDLLEPIPSSEKKEILQKSIAALKSQALAGSAKGEKFHEEAWLPFQKKVLNDYSDMGAHWQLLLIESVLKELSPQQERKKP